MAKEYHFLDPKKVLEEGELISQTEYGHILKKKPLVDESKSLVGFLFPFTQDEGFSILIENSRDYTTFKDAYGRAWFPAGAIGCLFYLPKERVSQLEVETNKATRKMSVAEIKEILKDRKPLIKLFPDST
ncbi:MAG: hypothetical protein AABW50_01560 [Nanoarchaeota archaeon]